MNLPQPGCVCSACSAARRAAGQADAVRLAIRDAYVAGLGTLARLAIAHHVSPSLVRAWASAERWTLQRRAREQAERRRMRGHRAVLRAVRDLERDGLERRQALRVILAVSAELELRAAKRDRFERLETV